MTTQTGVVSWSQTANTNATADSNVGMQEGMAPSAVNDGIRALMSSVAKWRDDIAGAILTSGTSTAFTVASNQSFSALSYLANQIIAFTPHTTCGATVTLNVDSLGAKPLRTAPSVELLSGTLIQGTPYVATYNNSDGAFYLHGFYANPFNIPLGGMMDYVGTTAPNSAFVLPQGQAISRTTYATLFALTGTTYGTGDGSTTFNVIDMVGRVGAMLDTGSARLSATYFGGNPAVLGAHGGVESHTLTTAEMPAHTHPNTVGETAHAHTASQGAHNTGQLVTVGSGNAGQGALSGLSGTGLTETATAGVTITNVAQGGGGAHASVQPTIIVNKILRVL